MFLSVGRNVELNSTSLITKATLKMKSGITSDDTVYTLELNFLSCYSILLLALLTLVASRSPAVVMIISWLFLLMVYANPLQLDTWKSFKHFIQYGY